MPLMQTNSGEGSFTTYVKYNAKAGRFYTKGDEQGAEEYEVKTLTAVFDLANIRTGWFHFAAGMAPTKVYDPVAGQQGPKPDENSKYGFEVKMFSDKNLGGVREMTSTADIVKSEINALYDAYEAAPESKQGKLPVVTCAEVKGETNKHGTNYRPIFKIVKWVDRPAELGSAPAAPSAAASTPAAASSGHLPPPQPAMADDTDF